MPISCVTTSRLLSEEQKSQGSAFPYTVSFSVQAFIPLEEKVTNAVVSFFAAASSFFLVSGQRSDEKLHRAAEDESHVVHDRLDFVARKALHHRSFRISNEECTGPEARVFISFLSMQDRQRFLSLYSLIEMASHKMGPANEPFFARSGTKGQTSPSLLHTDCVSEGYDLAPPQYSIPMKHQWQLLGQTTLPVQANNDLYFRPAAKVTQLKDKKKKALLPA